MCVKTGKDLKEGMEKMFSLVLIPYLEQNANTKTGMISEISRMEVGGE
jgi:hypothetical protein